MIVHWQRLARWTLHRLAERSTWCALFTLATTLTGRAIRPDLADSLAMIGLGLATAISVATREKDTDDDD